MIHRYWVLDHAKNRIVARFNEMRAQRLAERDAELRSLPLYTYQMQFGPLPLSDVQSIQLRSQMQAADHRCQSNIDMDWRACCKQYPEVLDEYYGLVGLRLPDDETVSLIEDGFAGTSAKGKRRIEDGSANVGVSDDDDCRRHRRKEKRRMRPAAPSPPRYDHR